MSPASDSNPSDPLPIQRVLFAIGDYKRWKILECIVTSGEAQMVKDLAVAAGISAPACSKQMGVLLKSGLVVRGKGGLYHITPALRPPPGVYTLEFGFLTVRFSPPAN